MATSAGYDPGARTTVFENELASVFWNVRLEAVDVVWKPTPIGALSYRRVLLAGLGELARREGRFWLAHSREMAEVPASMQRWTADEWFPKAYYAGLRRLALVIPRAEITVESFEDISEQLPKLDFARQYFPDADSAARWLRTQGRLLDAGIRV